jgi:hypothetical protein
MRWENNDRRVLQCKSTKEKKGIIGSIFTYVEKITIGVFTV